MRYFVNSTVLVAQPVPNVAKAKSGPPASNQKTVSADMSTLVAALRSGLFGKIRRDKFALENRRDDGTREVKLADEEVTRLQTDMEHAGFSRINRRDLEHAAELVAKDNTFDSMKDWLHNLPLWDGTKRVSNFLPAYFNTRGTPYSYAVGNYIWTAMVARILEPGYKVDMVPVLVGEQGVRKTTALTVMAPTPAQREDATLSDRTSKLAYTTIGKTVLAWEELQGIRGRVDADQVKTFITLPHVDIPGSKKGTYERYLRRFVIFGTSDRYEFLQDPAGNRRYLPFEVKAIDITKLEADKLQLWAEAFEIVKIRQQANSSLVDFADAERLAPLEHRDFSKRAPWADSKKLKFWVDNQATFFSTPDAMEAIGIPPEDFPKNRTKMAGSLRQLECISRSTRVPGMSNPQPRWHRI